MMSMCDGRPPRSTRALPYVAVGYGAQLRLTQSPALSFHPAQVGSARLDFLPDGKIVLAEVQKLPQRHAEDIQLGAPF